MKEKRKIMDSISVIIPLYNTEGYIERCLESVCKQINNNDEIIIIDDGSTDSSYEIASKYKRKCKNIILIQTKNNGLSAARNIGVSRAKCDYLLFLDSDDYLSNNTFNNFKEVISKHKPEVILGGSNKYLMNGKKETRILNIDEGMYNINKLLKEIGKVSEDPPIPVCYYLYKKDFITSNNYEFFENHIHEDELWTQQILLNVSKIYYSKFVFYNYCVRNNSIMTSTNINKSGEDLLEICVKIKELYDSNKNDIPNILKNRFAEMLLMSNYQLDNNRKLIDFTGRMLPIKYSYNKKTFIKSLLFMFSPSLHRKIERYRLKLQ